MSMNATTSLSCHDDVWLLLPWYVNQSLSDRERQLVEAHLGSCVTCRGELNAQRQLQEGIRNSATSELCESIQLENLVQKIQESQGEEPAAARAAMKTRLRAGGYAIAASLLLVMLLPLIGGLPPEVRNYNYNTLSGPSAVSAARAEDIRVIFSAALDSSGRRQLLSLVNGRILSEPDANAVYLVRIDTAGEDGSADTARALTFLHGHPQVVFAEPAISARQ